MVVHRYDAVSFKEIPIPESVADHPVAVVLRGRVESGALGSWRVGYQHTHICSISTLPDGQTELFVSCAAIDGFPWEFIFGEYRRMLLKNGFFETLTPEATEEETATRQKSKLASCRARLRWRRALGEVLWNIRQPCSRERLHAAQELLFEASEAYKVWQLKTEQLKMRLDKNPHSHVYKAAISKVPGRLLLHYKRLFGDTYGIGSELFEQHARELTVGTQLLKRMIPSLIARKDILVIRENVYVREWFFQTWFSNDDLRDEQLRLLGLSKMHTPLDMNYYKMAQCALAECCHDYKTWNRFEALLSGDDPSTFPAQLRRFIARGIGVPRSYWTEQLEARNTRRRLWQRAIRFVVLQVRTDAEATANNAALAEAQRRVRAAAAEAVKPQRALTLPGQSHKSQPLRWTGEAPDACSRAKRESSKAASIRAALATKADKKARAAHEAKVALEMARNLAIGDAIVED
jgi:hypothetical protein